MKLGTETGSLINHVMANSGFGPEPHVGMAATVLYWSDRSPATVIEVNMKKRYIVVQDDDFIRTDNNGMSESQQYEFVRNEKGMTRIFRKNKKGEWVYSYINPETNRIVKAGGCHLRLGSRDKYHDYSF